MGLSIDTTRSYPIIDSPSQHAPEPTREEKLAAFLWKKYGMEAFRHGALMCAREDYKKIGYRVVGQFEKQAATICVNSCFGY